MVSAFMPEFKQYTELSVERRGASVLLLMLGRRWSSPALAEGASTVAGPSDARAFLIQPHIWGMCTKLKTLVP